MSTTVEIDTGHSRSFGGLLSWARQELRPVERVGRRQAMSAARSGCRGAAAGLITVVVMMATIMQALDGTIANVALPNIQGSLSATQEQVSWVITSYIVSAAIMTPLAGFCAVRFGLRRILVSSVIGFTIASMLCGAAQTLDQLVLFRVLQGVFGAALVPLSQALMMDTYPREEQGKAMAMWGVGTMLGPIIGPTLGGWLTDEYHLALGVLHQPAGRHPVRDRPHDPGQEQGERHAAAVRPAGLHLLAIAIGTLPAHARPRRAARLVQLQGDHRRAAGGGRRLPRCS